MAKRAHKDTPKDKLDELKAKQFTAKGRKQRIAKALEILNRPSPTFKLDRDTVKSDEPLRAQRKAVHWAT